MRQVRKEEEVEKRPFQEKKKHCNTLVTVCESHRSVNYFMATDTDRLSCNLIG